MIGIGRGKLRRDTTTPTLKTLLLPLDGYNRLSLLMATVDKEKDKTGDFTPAGPVFQAVTQLPTSCTHWRERQATHIELSTTAIPLHVTNSTLRPKERTAC